MSHYIKYVRKFFSLAHPLCKEVNYSPVFIIGSGRSGNTLLRRFLMGSGKIYIPPETYVLGNIIREFQQNSRIEWDALCKIVLFNFASSEDFYSFPTYNLRDLYLSLQDTDKEERTLAFILNEFYRYMGIAAGYTDFIWGDKTPLNVFYLSEIDQVFPDAKYIHIYRDGCDVVYSYLQMGRYNKIEDAAQRWLNSVKLSREFGYSRKNRYLELSYEDLVISPENKMSNVCDFLEINYSSEILKIVPAEKMGDVVIHQHHKNVINEINKKSIGKGRKNLTMSEMLLLKKLIGKRLIELGYDLPETH